MKRIVLWLAFVLGTLTVSAQTGSLTAELSLDQDQYLSGEDMPVHVRIVNRSGQDVVFGKDNAWIMFAIQGDNNFIAQKLGDAPMSGEFTLRSAQAGTRTINLTPYFDFRQPGHYRIAAVIKVAQWGKDIACQPVEFSVVNGVKVLNVPELVFGVPPAPGASNTVPEVRKYILQKVTTSSEMKLYVRVADESGTRTLRVIPIDRMVSFSEPEVQVDGASNLHLLHQTGAKTFNYAVISPDGEWLVRQTHMYTQTRPTLRMDENRKIYVSGGVRRVARTDLPPTGIEANK